MEKTRIPNTNSRKSDDGSTSPQGVVTGGGRRSEADSLDCFNEDLIWIVDKLVARSGGTFGIISRHVHGEHSATELARTSGVTVNEESICRVLAEESRFAISEDCRRRDDVPCLREIPWSDGVDAQSGQGYRLLQLAFAPTQTVSLIATVCRADAGVPFSELEVLTAGKLYPVLSRYVRLWWLHRMERRRANSLSAALDLSDIGVILLDRRSEIVFANRQAKLVLDRSDGLRQHERTIVASDPLRGFRLHAAIQYAQQRNRSGIDHGAVESSAPILALERSPGRRALVAAVTPVSAVAVDPRDPAVIIYVFDPERNVEQMLAPICDMYEMTNAEARLVRHLVSGLRINDAADAMRIQPDTARAYLKQVFAKTRTNRQVDLVRLMLASLLRAQTSTEGETPANHERSRTRDDMPQTRLSGGIPQERYKSRPE